MLNNFYFKDMMYCSKMNKTAGGDRLTERIKAVYNNEKQEVSGNYV